MDIHSELIFVAWCTYPRNETLVHQQLSLHQLHHHSNSQSVYNTDLRMFPNRLCVVFLALTQLRYRYTLVGCPSSAQQVGCLCLSSCLYMLQLDPISTCLQVLDIQCALASKPHFTPHVMAMLIAGSRICAPNSDSLFPVPLSP